MTILVLALALGVQPEPCAQTCAEQTVAERQAQHTTLFWSGVGIAGAGTAMFLATHGGAVAVTQLAGAPPQVVGRVAIPLVGPALTIAETGVPDEFIPVAVGLFGAQALGIGAMLIGSGMAGSAMLIDMEG